MIAWFRPRRLGFVFVLIHENLGATSATALVPSARIDIWKPEPAVERSALCSPTQMRGPAPALTHAQETRTT